MRTAMTISAVLLLAGSVKGRVIVAAPGGLATAAGTAESPLSVHAAVEGAKAGDVVVLRGGVYELDRPVRVAVRGTAELPFVLRSAEGERAVLDGSKLQQMGRAGRAGAQTGMGLVTVDDSAWVTIRDIEVRSSRYVGLLVTDPTSEGISLIGCQSHGSYGPGILLHRGRKLRVIGCTVTGANDQGLRPTGVPLRREAPHEAISLMQVEDFEVAYCRVHKCHKEGIDIKETASFGRVHHNECYDLPRQGIYVDCWFGKLRNVEIDANVVHDCEWGIAVSAEGREASMSDIWIHHNVVYRNRASGLLFGTWGNDGPRERIYVYHNTIVDNGLALRTGTHWAGTLGGVDIRARNLREVYIVSNIVHGNVGFDFASVDPGSHEGRRIVVENNLTGALSKLPQLPGMFETPVVFAGAGTIVGDPAFVLPRGADFRLKVGSAALGAARGRFPFEVAGNVGCAQNAGE
jgi:hypothetical protein